MNKLISRAKYAQRRNSMVGNVSEPPPVTSSFSSPQAPGKKLPSHVTKKSLDKLNHVARTAVVAAGHGNGNGNRQVRLNAVESGDSEVPAALQALHRIRRASLVAQTLQTNMVWGKSAKNFDALFFLPVNHGVSEVLDRMAQIPKLNRFQFMKLLKLGHNHKSRMFRSIALAALFTDSKKGGFNPVYVSKKQTTDHSVEYDAFSQTFHHFTPSATVQHNTRPTRPSGKSNGASQSARKHQLASATAHSSNQNQSSSGRRGRGGGGRTGKSRSIFGMPLNKLTAAQTVETKRKEQERERYEKREDKLCFEFLFKCFDRQGQGFVVGNRAAKSLRLMLLGTTAEQIKSTYDALDWDQDGFLGTEDLVLAHEYTHSALIKRDLLALLDLCDKKIDVDLGARRKSLDYHNDARLFEKVQITTKTSFNETKLAIDEFCRVFAPPGYPPAVPSFMNYVQLYFHAQKAGDDD